MPNYGGVYHEVKNLTRILALKLSQKLNMKYSHVCVYLKAYIALHSLHALPLHPQIKGSMEKG